MGKGACLRPFRLGAVTVQLGLGHICTVKASQAVGPKEVGLNYDGITAADGQQANFHFKGGQGIRVHGEGCRDPGMSRLDIPKPENAMQRQPTFAIGAQEGLDRTEGPGPRDAGNGVRDRVTTAVKRDDTGRGKGR